MERPVKEFFHRGLIFGGFGPIVMALIYFILSFSEKKMILSCKEVFIVIISTYILAFVHAGSSVFNQIEEWPIMKSILYHFSALYIAYTLCYLINSWLPFDFKVVLIYTFSFVVLYFVIWLAVLISLKIAGKKLNRKLK